MGINILKTINYKGEKLLILKLKVQKIKSINCPPELNSGAIDEFLIIFLVAAKQMEFLTLRT